MKLRVRRVLAPFTRPLCLGVLFIAACGPKPPARTALVGSLADLKRDIASAQQAGKLDRDEVVELARAVGERELTSAEGSGGASRVRSLRSCARPLRSAMERRARAEDEVAAELALILLETGVLDRPASLNRYARAEQGAWRAVAARAAVRSIDTDMRRAYFVDPDQRVRRAAFASALEAHEPAELEALLEAARVDPDPLARSAAVRAVGSIGSERAVLALKDMWARADDLLRIAIVDAWSAPASFNTGGARELTLAAESGTGLAAVSASYALARTGGVEAVTSNARLRRNISDGSDDEKRLALSVAPLNTETEIALAQAAKEASPEMRVVALTRLLGVEARRAAALRGLREVVALKAGSESEARARTEAISALASAGDASVHATLLENVKGKDLSTRARAARGLTNLGDYGNAATALADDDANLRSEVACWVLARETPSR